MSADYSTIATNLKAAAGGGQTPVDKVIAATPISNPAVGAADGTLTGREAIFVDLSADLVSKYPSEIEAYTDLNTLISTPVSNTAANLKAMVTGNARWGLNNGTATIIATTPADSADGLHMGVIGQQEMAGYIRGAVETVLA